MFLLVTNVCSDLETNKRKRRDQDSIPRPILKNVQKSYILPQDHGPNKVWGFELNLCRTKFVWIKKLDYMNIFIKPSNYCLTLDCLAQLTRTVFPNQVSGRTAGIDLDLVIYFIINKGFI